MNKKVFFDGVRKSVFKNSLSQSQVDGVELLLDLMIGLKLNIHFVAYIMATVAWETGRTFQPVREGFNASEDWRKKNLRYFPWYGRGYVQLTWETNYAKATKWFKERLGITADFVKNKDLALDPKLSAVITIVGMVEGWFTKKKLGDYLLAGQFDPRNARKIVNGMDRADEIALLSGDFYQALTQAGYSGHQTAVDLTVVSAFLKGSKPVPEAPKGSSGLLLKIIAGAIGFGVIALGIIGLLPK